MNAVRDMLIGCSVGDALGVPFEFKSRGTFKCAGMVGHGTHNQPTGTWSDDTSMTLCLADCIAGGFSVNKLAQNFLKWYRKGEYTAGGNVFDIGNATANALYKIENGVSPVNAGGTDEWSNGNGSLMRIAPLVFYTKDMTDEKRFEICKQVSSVTHRHEISVSACFIYTEFLRALLNGERLEQSFNIAVAAKENFSKFGISRKTVEKFSDVNKELGNYAEERIKSSGYVIDTLIASFWCLLTTNSFKDAVLKAVNLGDDTDTTGAVTGAAAGLLYGENSIPKEWLDVLKNKELIYFISKKVQAI